MPYIKQSQRDELEEDGALSPRPDNPGELNYCITMLTRDYLGDPDSGNGTINYEKYNSVIGVLECVKQELYRRMIVPYEEQKIKENGDVY
jgi:hypothetical protein